MTREQLLLQVPKKKNLIQLEAQIQNYVDRLKLKTHMRRKAILNVFISHEIEFYSREITIYVFNATMPALALLC